MKHVANRKKAVSPLPRKSYTQPKIAVKKASGVVAAAKSGKQSSTKTAESAPIIQERNAKPKSVQTRKQAAGTELKAANLNKKKNAVAAKPAPTAGKRVVKQKAEKPVVKIVAETVKTKVQKSKPVAAVVKKNLTAKVSPAKAKLKVAARVETPKSIKTAPKVSAVKSIKKVLPKQSETKKDRLAKVKVQTVKVEKAIAKKTAVTNKIAKKVGEPKVKVAVKTAAVAPKVAPPTAKSKKIVQPPAKIKPVPTVKKSVAETLKTKLPISSSTANRTPKKASPTIAETLPLIKANKAKIVAAPIKTVITKARKIKTEKTSNAAPVKISSPKKVELAAPPVEVVNAPLPKPRKKKVKPLGAAIFRGKKERYDFQVFPIEGEFEDAAAIFIISRRVVDKNRRAHHRMVCIGQTISVLSELKKHRKGKCFKQHEANAISVLREENEQKRLKIEADLRSAHTIPCPHA